ncbi:MAG: tetratricopeptide repeat protein [Janthinobacterium lividum]
MAKSWPWLLSLLLLPALAWGQHPIPTPDCASRAYQDTLVARYLDRGAERVGYLDPRWAMYCDSVIARCPRIAQAYQLKAVPLIKDGKYADAFALEDQAVAIDPHNWLAYRGFLKCIFSKDYEGALVDFERVTLLKPNGREMDHTYPFFEGLCHLELGQLPQAVADFGRDIQLQQGSSGKGDVHYNSQFYQGVVYFEQKNYAQASRCLRQCLSQYARHPDANYYSALVCQAQGNRAEATKHLQTAHEALAAGYRLNEDNIFYVNYLHQITDYEVGQALQ